MLEKITQNGSVSDKFFDLMDTIIQAGKKDGEIFAVTILSDEQNKEDKLNIHIFNVTPVHLFPCLEAVLTTLMDNSKHFPHLHQKLMQMNDIFKSIKPSKSIYEAVGYSSLSGMTDQ